MRGMYHEEKNSRRRVVLELVLLALLLVLLVRVKGRMSRDFEAQRAQAVRAAVLKSAVQCYSVEGAYPSSLSHLEEKYGLVLNHRKYIVSYEAYASNLMPQVRVLVRGEEEP